jgi:uncharacterized phage infection (PIP) family protein YhgE
MTLPPLEYTTMATFKSHEASCPNCGHSLAAPSTESHQALLQAQRQIAELQAQVELLNQKANAAVDRWADYEDEISRLRAASTSTNATTSYTNNSNNERPHTPAPSAPDSSPRSSFLGAATASRISQLLTPRRSNSNSNTTTAPSTPVQRGSLTSVSSPALDKSLPAPPDSTAELRELLQTERQRRVAAEAKLDATSREVEDLSASLFEQANEMVATERRARAKLEEKIEIMGLREKEKGERVRRLEGAVLRIERARGVLGLKENEDAEGGLFEERVRDGD